MEAKETGTRRRYTGIRIAAAIVAAFLIYYAVMYSVARSRKLGELSSTYEYKSGKEQTDKAILTDSAFVEMLREKAFLQAKTLMAGSDSIYLSLNLRDSLSDIEISGVTVHSAKISSYDVSSIIMKGERSFVYNMLSQPFTIDSAWATIRKEPIMEKIAPRDTSEFQPAPTPDTTIIESVHYLLSMNNGIRLIVCQDEINEKGDLMNKFMFELRMRLNDTWSALKSVIRFRVPEYHPYIRIWLPREDARIIYRALPVRGQVAVYT